MAAEDTRRTRGLLTHYGISKPLVSLREHNEHREAPRLVERLQAGESIAVVTDAGTPGISDPGAGLVRLSRQAGVRVVPIPGPSAVTAALSASGLSLESFVFAGFPPATGALRQDWFQTIADEPRAVVFLESPHRLRKTLVELVNCGINGESVVAREISKKFEEFVVYQNTSIAVQNVRDEGEFVVILAPKTHSSVGNLSSQELDRAISLVGHITEFGNLSDDAALAGSAAAFDIPVAKLRKLAKKARFARNRQLEER